MSTFRIRSACLEDIDAVLRIEDESFDPAIREDRNVFQERLEVFQEGFVVLEGPNGPAGYLCSELWTLSGKPTESDFALGHSARGRHDPKGETLYISSFGILSKYRGRGLGRRLFNGFLMRIRDRIPFREVLLLASETWTSALALYEEEGFTHALTVPNFFRFSDGSRAGGLVLYIPRDKGTPLEPLPRRVRER